MTGAPSPSLAVLHRATYAPPPSAPFVSVLMPCYNHEATVEQAVRSVLDQTYPHVEVVVVDDGSKDASVEVLEALVRALSPEQAARLTVARKDNGGVGAALNDARTLARGSHLGFLATDDWFAPEKIERQLAALAALDPPEGVVHTGAYNVFPDGERVSAAGSYWPAQGQCFEDLLAVRVTCIGPSVFMPARVFDAVGGYDPSFVAEDGNLFCRLAHRGYPFVFLPEPLVYKRAHRGSLGGQPARWVADCLRTLDELGADLPEATQRQIRAELYAGNMRQAMGARDYPLARAMARGLATVVGETAARKAYRMQRLRYGVLALVPERVRMVLRHLRSRAAQRRLVRAGLAPAAVSAAPLASNS